jgi:hypothetical protein
MTESTWLSCQEPQKMLLFLWNSGKAGERKLRLLACARCRRAWRLLTEVRSRTAVETAERHADALAGEDEREAGREPARQVVYEMIMAQRFEEAAVARDAWLALEPATERVIHYMQPGSPFDPELDDAGPECRLIREVFKNPVHPVAFDPSWRTPTVRALAERAYLERQLPAGTLDARLLAVLADALEEAGCDNQEMVLHLRQQGAAHVRGCWCVDFLLEKD